MPPTPDADTDDNGTDQPDTDPSSQPGTAISGDEASTAPDTREAEADADCDATEPGEAATDTGDSEGEPFPPRGTLTLRALRWAGVVGAAAFGATALLLSRELTEASSAIPDKASTLMWCMFFGGLLVWPFFNFREKKGPIPTTIVTTVMAALGVTASASLTLAWWDTYQETGFSVLFLLALAGVTLSAALFLSAGTLLHYLRMRTTQAGIGDPNDPSRWRRLHIKTGEKTDKGLPHYERIRVPRRTRAYFATLIIAPALTLGSAIAGTWALINPVHHVIAKAPADASLEPPTSLAPKASWSKEISSTELSTVAGAGGPILLTDDGVMALSSKDGSVLWSYERKHANFDHNFLDFTNTTAPLVTSPNGKYVALRVLSPKFVESAGDTLVFDTLTGRIIFKNKNGDGPLQLTDSAVLDGNSAFSLTDGKKLWNLSDGDRVDYSGTAGHASFILSQNGDDQHRGDSPQSYKSTITLRITPQEDLSAAVEVDNVLAGPPDHPDYPAIPVNFIQGWAARYTGEIDSSGDPVAEAISLDALAKVDGADTRTVPLGATSGISEAASLRSGNIVTYSPIRLDNGPQDFPSEPRTEKVFDPSTLTVTPITQYPGFTGSPIEFVDVPADDGSLSAAITVRPGDGSAGTTIPIAPGSTHLPPTLLARSSRTDNATERAQATRVPGAVIATFNATDDIGRDCTRGKYDQSEQCTHTYRIYGIMGEQK
ncbi:DMT family transporter [Actinomyces oris]|uniref:DMT family transporter n=1 Tax=Actinomyces oris TaxID=544580 RepID=UPI00288BC6E6|nr:DMT family transporter [Actinomyces oris]